MDQRLGSIVTADVVLVDSGIQRGFILWEGLFTSKGPYQDLAIF